MSSFFSRLFGANADARPQHEQKYSRAAKLLAMHSIGVPQWTPRNYTELTRQGYERNAVCYRAVRMIAEAVASVPWMVFQGREEIIEHPLLDLIEQPNPNETGVTFIEALCTNLLLYGNAYIEAGFIDGVLREVYALRPDRIRVEPGKNGWPAAYVYTVQGDQLRYVIRGEGIEPILHIKLFNPLDDHYGFAPLGAAQVALDTHNAASFWNKALLDNSARPSGALVYAGPDGAHLSDDQFTRLKQELEENFSGSANAGRPLLLEGGLDWKALSLSPKDMDFTEAKAGAAREIALAFGVPPLLLGLPGDNTFKNYQEANRAFWRQTVIPFVARLQKSFHSYTQPGYAPFRFDYNVDRIEALAEERASEWNRIGKASFLTVDEQREAVGYGKMAMGVKYAPDQPRMPAGSRDGGQFASGGGAGTQTEQTALNVDRNIGSNASSATIPAQAGYPVDLREEEAAGGHTIEKHVGKSEEYLIRRSESTRFQVGKYDLWEANGSFSSMESAGKLVNSTLSENRTIVDNVATGDPRSATIKSFFNSPTGYSSYAPSYKAQLEIRNTYGVRVVLRHDVNSTKGYRIITSFPISP